MGRYANEHNLMELYFSPDSATYKVIGIVRDGFRKGICRTINPNLIQIASSEVQTKRKELDKSTYPFAQDLSMEFYREGAIRVVMLIEGTLVGSERSIDSVIGADLGKNPHRFFKDDAHVSDTIDAHVTTEQVMAYLRHNQEALSNQGFTHYLVDRSRVFYLRSEDVKRFLDSNELNFEQLVPFLLPTRGYVGLVPVENPTIKEYKKAAPAFIAYRLKGTVMQKLLKRLGEKHPEPIKDWVAHRIVTDSEGEARILFNSLRVAPKIGNYGIEIVDEDDRPKPSGFRANVLVVRVLGKGCYPCVREIQIVDREQYHKNEFVAGASSHEQHEKRRRHRPRSKRNEVVYYGEILREIFGREQLKIGVP